MTLDDLELRLGLLGYEYVPNPQKSMAQRMAHSYRLWLHEGSGHRLVVPTNFAGSAVVTREDYYQDLFAMACRTVDLHIATKNLETKP